MATRTRSDIQQRLIQHVEATRRCRQWAAKAVEYREAGKLKEAREAEEKARRYMLRIMKIEGRQ